ncbi:MAG: DUF192 domain-containing protein [archaeon]|nr:DUF192 domain-containing protein [Nanoarchaeota archaeon]
MITNKTTKEKISEKEINANTYCNQAWGLMFRKKQNLVMTFKHPRIISLHNFFVFYPLEIVVLDENKKVVEVKKRFSPFTLWSSARKGKYLLELTLPDSKGKCKVGDRLKL